LASLLIDSWPAGSANVSSTGCAAAEASMFLVFPFPGQFRLVTDPIVGNYGGAVKTAPFSASVSWR
jgi:hypothetical protein